jgi:hypothetical protein
VSKTRNLSDLLDANGDVKSTALDNVPASDVVNDTTPQLGGHLASNGNNIQMADTDKIQFGASNDLEIYHDGSNSIIKDEGTGNLILRGTQLNLATGAGTKSYVECTQDQDVALFYNGSEKLTTTNTGATVTGTLTATAFSGDGSALTNVPAGVSSVKTVVFTSSGTYTPTSGTKFVTVYATGGGGGGAGTDTSANNETQKGGSGGGGGTAIRTYNATELGATASVTVGGGGSAGGSGSNGSTGGTSNFNPAGTGTTIFGDGGTGGYFVQRDNGSATGACGNSGSAVNGQINVKGHNGLASPGGLTGAYGTSSNRKNIGQIGGPSMFGNTTRQLVNEGSTANGNSGTLGSGGNGGVKSSATGTCSGGSGGSGVVVIMEYA